MNYTNEQIQRTADQLLHIASDELVDGSLLKSLKQATGGTSWRERLAWSLRIAADAQRILDLASR